MARLFNSKNISQDELISFQKMEELIQMVIEKNLLDDDWKKLKSEKNYCFFINGKILLIKKTYGVDRQKKQESKGDYLFIGCVYEE